MERAVVAIGVKSTGGLPELQAAVESATAFARWARESQGIPEDRVILITDADGRVTRDRIFEAIETITNLGFVEQLLVYFSGHGINANRNETWLLSRAPGDPGAAVNVAGSELLARSCGIAHVVLISDACRTAADTIQAGRVTGGEIFPNRSPGGAENPVDQFFATLVGHPSFEVKDVQESSQRFRAAYTTVLLSALTGAEPAIVEQDPEGKVIRPHALKKHLKAAVPAYLDTLDLHVDVNQEPDARIESEPGAWIARLPEPPAAPRATTRGTVRSRVGLRGPAPAPPAAAAVAPSIASEAQSRLEQALGLLAPAASQVRATARRSAPRPGLRGARPAAEATEVGPLFQGAVGDKDKTFGVDRFESRCGIKLRGGRLAAAKAPHGKVEIADSGDSVRVVLERGRKAVNVMLEFEDGTGALVAALDGYVAALTFDGQGELDDLSYEPSADTSRWHDFQVQAAELRKLRAVVAASSSLGVFILEDEHAEALLESMRRAKGLDPSLAVYAAHAFHARRMRDQIRDMQNFLRRDLDVRLFDVAMLAGELGSGKRKRWPADVFPCLPQLAQGWALIDAFGIRLPGRLAELRPFLRPSLWSHFDAHGVKLLRQTVAKGEVD